MVKILLVEDEPDMVQIITDILQAEGYEVTSAPDGEEALVTLKSFTPDLIVTDISMPKMDGWDVCAKIKSNKKTENIPIAFLTARTDTISKGIGSLASAYYIEKPIKIKDLKKRIDEILNKKG